MDGGVVEYFEARADSWIAAADALIAALVKAGIRKGHVLSVSAHNNGEDTQPTFSAHVCRKNRDCGRLHLGYEYSDSSADWDEHYRVACCNGNLRDVIAVTGSCTTASTRVLFVFFYAEDGNPLRVVSDLEYLECRASTWLSAAETIVDMLVAEGVQHGQVVSVDAHNECADGDAIFSAFYSKKLHGLGKLTLSHIHQNSDAPWEHLYRRACNDMEICVLEDSLMIGVTGSCNASRSVYFIWFCHSASKLIARCVEVRCDSWVDAADEIIAALQNKGARRGQVLSIDAHNNGVGEAAIFSAYYCLGLEDMGELNIKYEHTNSDEPWASAYDMACKHAEGKDVISMTGSCNTQTHSVLFVFFYDGISSHSRTVSEVKWVEFRSGSWCTGATGVIQRLKDAGVQRGQLIYIDAHNNNSDDGEAIFCAFYSIQLQGRGTLSITYQNQNTSGSWAQQYDRACDQLRPFLKAPNQIVGLTSACNCQGTSVTFLFTMAAPGPGSLFDIAYVESHAATWNEAADAIICNLKDLGVLQGQVLSIDAHTKEDRSGATFSAFYCKSLIAKGALDIGYSYTIWGGTSPAGVSWTKAYEKACIDAADKDLISITGSCNGKCHSVMYLFYYEDSFRDLKSINYVEVRSGGWTSAAELMVSRLTSLGIQAGQVISIDAHSAPENDDAIFSAFYSKHLPAQGRLKLRYAEQVDHVNAWESIYEVALEKIRPLSLNQFVSTTSSCMAQGRAVHYVWFQDKHGRLCLSDVPVSTWTIEGLWQLHDKKGCSFFAKVMDGVGVLNYLTPRTMEGEQKVDKAGKLWDFSSLRPLGDNAFSPSAKWEINGGPSGRLNFLFEGPRRALYTMELEEEDGTSSSTEGFMLKLLDSHSRELQTSKEINLEGLRNKGPGSMPEDPVYWGISLRQLQHLRASMLSLFENDDGSVRDPHMYDVNTLVVKPLTKDLNLSLATLYNRNLPGCGRKAHVFLSHSWAESFLALVGTLETAVGSQHPLSICDVAWICTFAIYQNMTAEQIAAHISSPPDSPFARVLRNVEEVAVIFNDRVSLYTRVWCVYECYLAIKTGKPLRALGLPPNWREAAAAVLKEPEHEWPGKISAFCTENLIDVRLATASVQADLDSIMAAISGVESDVNNATNCLSQWAMKDILVGEFAAAGVRHSSFRDRIRKREKKWEKTDATVTVNLEP